MIASNKASNVTNMLKNIENIKEGFNEVLSNRRAYRQETINQKAVENYKRYASEEAAKRAKNEAAEAAERASKEAARKAAEAAEAATARTVSKEAAESKSFFDLKNLSEDDLKKAIEISGGNINNQRLYEKAKKTIEDSDIANQNVFYKDGDSWRFRKGLSSEEQQAYKNLIKKSQKDIISETPIMGRRTNQALKKREIDDGIFETIWNKSWHDEAGSIKPMTIARDIGGVAIAGTAIKDGLGIINNTRTVNTDEYGNKDIPFIPFV